MDLLTHIEASLLPLNLGGLLVYDHKAWVRLQKVRDFRLVTAFKLHL